MIARFSLLLVVSVFLAGCFSETVVPAVNNSLQPARTVRDSIGTEKPSYIDYEYDKALLDRLNNENEKFRQIPDEFKKVDFENFKYDFGRLKNGELEIRDSKNLPGGGQRYTLREVFYLDLIGDAGKEAIVVLYVVSCGVSCDGGRDLIHFYSADKGKKKRIAVLETGSNSSGCSLKSFTVRDKTFYIEQFGQCVQNTTFEQEPKYVCKFCTKDETHSVYSMSEKGLKRESVKIIQTKMINLRDSPAYISINE